MASDATLLGELHFSLNGFHEILCNKLCSLWKSSQLCDLTLQASGGSVQVHSCVLAAFSSTIANILCTSDQLFHEKKERSKKHVTIVVDHLNIEVFQSIMSFIYTGQLVISSKHAKKLLDTSKWMNIQDLVSLIEKTICEREQQSLIHHSNQNQHVKQVKHNNTSTNAKYTDAITNKNINVFDGETEVANNVDSQTIPSIGTCSSLSQKIKSPRKVIIVTSQSSPEAAPTTSTSTQSDFDLAVSPSAYSSTKITNPTSQRVSHSSCDTVMSSKDNSSNTSSHPLIPISKVSKAVNCAQFNAPNLPCRRGKRQRKRTKKWEESYMFSSSSCEPGDLKRCSVSLIKIEIDDPSDYIISSDNQNFPHNDAGCLSITKRNDEIVENSCENITDSCQSLNPNVLYGLIDIQDEVMEDDEIQLLINTSHECNSTEQICTDSEVSRPKYKSTSSSNDTVDNSNTSQIDTVDNSNTSQIDTVDNSNTSQIDTVDNSVDNSNTSQIDTVDNSNTSQIDTVDNSNTSQIDTVDNSNTSQNDTVDSSSITSQINGVGNSNISQITSTSRTASTDDSLTLKEVGQRVTSADSIGIIDRQTNTSNDGKLVKPSRSSFYPYVCFKCSSGFHDIDEHNEHINNHPIFSCQECPLFFYSENKLTYHHRSEHVKKSILTCKECTFYASTFTELCHHSAKEHNQPKPYACNRPGCSYRAHRPYIVSRHIEGVHAEKKNYVCSQCGKRFATLKGLKTHLNSCLRTEEHLCDLCGAAFNLRAYLNLHKNTVHFKIKQHKCSKCSKSFTNGANLRRHLRIHNNAYPYACPACDKKYRHSNSLKVHMKIHHRVGGNVDIPKCFENKNYKKRGRNSAALPI